MEFQQLLRSRLSRRRASSLLLLFRVPLQFQPGIVWSHKEVFYSQQGQTVPDNLVVLCGACHRNVHRGHLRIEGRAPDALRFLDRDGRDLERQHRLDMAHWLDIWLGWRGREWDSHYGRARAA